ncbi:MAG: hypothetical protein JWN04_1628 [Myxococcaceae bacterium]|nr:hypothetical protein [Myxococcaceae bacterium]
MASLCVTGVCYAPPPGAAADSVTFGPHDVRSVFHVEKSENQNQVHYGVRLDAACHPQGNSPVFAYWRRLRNDVRVDEPLVGPGTRVYGASNEQTVQVTAQGGHVETYVRALKRLTIAVDIQKGKEGCVAVPMVTLHGERVKLLRAYLQLGRFGITVKYVDVYGLREKDSQQVTEQFR